MVQRIFPTIRCHGTAEEAGQFYQKAFTKAGFTATSQLSPRAPGAGVAEPEESRTGEALAVDVTINDYTLRLLNAAEEIEPGVAISFMLNVDPLFFGGDDALARAAIDSLWATLNDGGTLRMSLQEYPFSPHYGWIEDRYGVNWQLMATNPGGDPRPLVLPSLMFSGPWQGKAEEAVDFYLGTFPSSSLGERVRYQTPTDTAHVGEVMFSDFQLLEQWFVAMDAGAPVKPFGPGFGFHVDGQTTAEIDRLRAALSTDPDTDAEGWMTDRYGVRWRLAPR